MLIKTITPLLLLLLLSNCAVMNESECVAADWRMVGMEEGLQGKSALTIGSYRKACAEYGVTPDLHAYQTGHLQGIKQYCSPQKAYQLGTQGQTLPSACPSNIHPNFLSQHHQGLKIYCTADTAYNLGRNGSPFPGICPQNLKSKLQFSFKEGFKLLQEVNSYQGEIDDISTHLEHINKDITNTENALATFERDLEIARAGIISSKTSNLEKLNFYKQKDRLKDEIRAAKNTLDQLYHEQSQDQSTINTLLENIALAEKRPKRYLAN